MLIIPRGGSGCGRRYRYYRGSGIFGTIARQLFSSGIKKAISSGARSAVAHKVADVVVNGATSASKQVANAIVREAASAAGKASASAVNTAINSVVNKIKGKKRPAPPAVTLIEQPYITVPPPVKRQRRVNIDSVIDGSGIVFD